MSKPLKSDKYISLIDVDNPNEENLYKTNSETPLYELFKYLKQKFGDKYCYSFIIRSQFYDGNIKEKVWNLVEDISQQKISILFKKNQQLEKERANEVMKYPANYQKQNTTQKSQSQEKNYTSNTQQNKDFAIIQQQKQNRINQDSNDKNQAIFSTQKQFQRTNQHINNNPQNDYDIQQQVQAQQKAFKFDIKQLIDTCCKEQFYEMNKKLENLEQQLKKSKQEQQKVDYNNKIKDLQDQINIQKIENEQLNKSIEELQKINISLKISNFEKQFECIKKDIQEIKQQINQQILQLSDQIQSMNTFLYEKQNPNNLVQSSIYYSSSSALLKQSTIQIQLKCNHRIERQKLEEIVQNAINKGIEPFCEICQTKLSTQNFKELGYLGDQYLQIQIEKNLSSLKQNIISKFGFQKVIICKNNCKFFCIYNPAQIKQEFYYCPICLQYSIKFLYEDKFYSTKKK